MNASVLSLADLVKIGRSIAERVPIAGATATEAEVAARGQLVRESLVALGLPTETLDHPARASGASSSRHTWHTIVLDNGRVVGQWADSLEEAVIGCSVWWTDAVPHIAVVDPDGSQHDAYTARAKGRAPKQPTLFDHLNVEPHSSGVDT